ncbi:hypothetical protein KGF54_003526 [Candida jiufengensis]|uniref:uncharacterized protein n=1 Tax=Candida jiufengensis TaxID=497108 RepID=UPI0022249650|nr:uncharacterized protein KGF54_003526 [Candida jiufengensis]KAI5952659.1 hypothetical protein KGF54_003526 [Candida jiufengensis]
MLIKFGLPNVDVWSTWPKLDTPLPPSPFQNEFLTKLYEISMHGSTPLTIAIIYFTSVHYFNNVIKNKQIKKSLQLESESKKDNKPIPKRLPAVPSSISKTSLFKVFVILHNIFLCVYSIWTFIGMTATIGSIMNNFKFELIPSFFKSTKIENYNLKNLELFFQSVCDSKNGLFSRYFTKSQGLHNLEILGFWFYISKFYEVIDTIIILLKGRPSSLLQSYHHAGAMLCMWSGVRFQSPPIWIFVVFNSFIHSLMYFYFTLSCLHIRVPTVFKKILTSMQITQFVVGGSIAVLHACVWIVDTNHIVSKDHLKLMNCISSPDQALPLLINIAYLTPLTALFGAFYIESYFKKNK